MNLINSDPWLPLLVIPAILLLFLLAKRSQHPMGPLRRLALIIVRVLAVTLVLVALTEPALEEETTEQTVIFVVDHSKSQGKDGLRAAVSRANDLMDDLPDDARVGVISVGESAEVVRMPSESREPIEVDPALVRGDGGASNLGSAVSLAAGLYPPRGGRRLVILSDGLDTRGDLTQACQDAALRGITVDAVPVSGPAQLDARLVRLRSSRARSHEGATIALSAELESSTEGSGLLRLFENGVEVPGSAKEVTLELGKPQTVVFKRTPQQRNLYRYEVRLEGVERDAIVENNQAMTLVEVRGRPLLLYIEGIPEEARYLADAMAKEGIQLEIRSPKGIPDSLQGLAGYDGIILSDVPARALTERHMSLIHDYVEKLGGGFLMIGGINSFGVGGYYRTPIEDILPVKMQPPDQEESFSTAVALVIDRSGSMSGQKIELCKSAAVATAEMLGRKDHIGVVAFDNQATWVVPMTRAGNKKEIRSRLTMLNAGGGTNIHPGLTAAYEAMRSVRAKVKHTIVLTDGHSSGSGYEALAAQMLADNITVSTVGVGRGAANQLLKSIAQAGGGKFYETSDPKSIPRIFTQDTAVHMGRLIREESFRPQENERHPMLAGWKAADAPALLGYVKTIKKETTQVPLVTDLGDPLLAHWRYNLGKVTAFTSDCKSRWAALWITGWAGYSQFWGQVLREMARTPQGHQMDMRLVEARGKTRVVVEVLDDAAQFRNNAVVEADVYFVPAEALGQQMRHVKTLPLDQSGPGTYEATFEPKEPGVYFVRGRAGADRVSAGLVHNVSTERATGWVDLELLKQATSASGGEVLDPDEDLEDEVDLASHSERTDLTWLFLLALLPLFGVDLLLRRWENLLGIYDAGAYYLLGIDVS